MKLWKSATVDGQYCKSFNIGVMIKFTSRYDASHVLKPGSFKTSFNRKFKQYRSWLESQRFLS